MSCSRSSNDNNDDVAFDDSGHYDYRHYSHRHHHCRYVPHPHYYHHHHHHYHFVVFVRDVIDDDYDSNNNSCNEINKFNITGTGVVLELLLIIIVIVIVIIIFIIIVMFLTFVCSVVALFLFFMFAFCLFVVAFLGGFLFLFFCGLFVCLFANLGEGSVCFFVRCQRIALRKGYRVTGRETRQLSGCRFSSSVVLFVVVPLCFSQYHLTQSLWLQHCQSLYVLSDEEWRYRDGEESTVFFFKE